MSALPALTVWQPWASMIAIDAKPYEFRGRRPPKSMVGRRIAIHAGARAIRTREVADLINHLSAPDLVWKTCLNAGVAAPFLDQVWDALRGRPTGAEIAFCPQSAVVCTAVLGEPRHGDEIAAEFGGASTIATATTTRTGAGRSPTSSNWSRRRPRVAHRVSGAGPTRGPHDDDR